MEETQHRSAQAYPGANPSMLLHGKVAVVTGAARGIGAAIARVLAREGAAVVVNYRPDSTMAEDVAAGIRAAGGEAVAIPADITDSVQVERLVRTAEETFGRLDVLVNNAAVSLYARLPEVSDECWDSTLAVNLTGAFRCTRAMIPAMVRAGGGRIVNIGSMGVRYGSSVGVAYAAAKGGLMAFTRTAARELAPLNILVNCVSAPLTETENSQRIWQYADPDSVMATLPLRRMATPEEVAELVAWVASPRNTYLTGENIWLSGGK